VARKNRRNGLVLLLTLVAAAILTGRLYAGGDAVRLAYVLAPVLVLGSVLSGGMPAAHRRKGRHPVVAPVLTGLLLFLFFLVAGAVVRLVPAFDHGVEEVLARADRGSTLAVALSAVVAGVAEELYYRGALFERVPLPIVTTTLAHVIATLPAGNVAMTAAAVALGGACGLSRRASGGWWTPAVVHATWSLLVLAFLPR
jgi:hypothetical protein